MWVQLRLPLMTCKDNSIARDAQELSPKFKSRVGWLPSSSKFTSKPSSGRIFLLNCKLMERSQPNYHIYRMGCGGGGARGNVETGVIVKLLGRTTEIPTKTTQR